ncbi:hypothetical protein GVAV_002847 [Gurleya vavrai]
MLKLKVKIFENGKRLDLLKEIIRDINKEENKMDENAKLQHAEVFIKEHINLKKKTGEMIENFYDLNAQQLRSI